MTRLLSLFGLMRVREHEKVKAERTRLAIVEGAQDDLIGDIRAERDDFRAKFKQAVADLEKQAGEIATLREEAEHLKAELWAATEQARDNVADAQKWRDYLKRARDRKAAKRGASK